MSHLLLRSSLTLGIVCAAILPLSAATNPESDPITTTPPAVAVAVAAAPNLEQAAVLVRDGYAAMQASNQDPSRSVEAALAFARALPSYEAAGDMDHVREPQANIFWCRKRMNHDDLDRYLKAKGNAAYADAAQRVDAITNRIVAKEEAGRWLADADQFALDHPDQAFAIAVRYFEVAERFAGTDASLSAQRKSLDYQSKASAGAEAAHRDTLFTRPTAPPSGRQPAPSAADIKTTQATLRKLYKDDFAERSEEGRRALARKLIADSRSTRDDPRAAFVMLEEALGLAEAVHDFDLLLTAADEQASRFEVDGGQIKRLRLGHLKADGTATAILKLLDDPADAAANTVAGRYYAFECRAWDIGFAMLAAGNDATLAKIAEMELARPDGATQMVELGDAWFDLGGPKNAQSIAAWERAMRWFEQALPQLSGVSKAHAQERMDTMFGLVFPAQMDWEHLTAAQWDKLKGVGVVVGANKPKNESTVVLKPGQRARVVPHPTDTWEFHDWFSDGTKAITWQGLQRQTRIIYSGDDGFFPLGALIMYTDPQKKALAGVITGPGKVVLASAQPSRASKGQIRVKIVPID